MAVVIPTSYAQEYKAITINNIDPESLMPKVEQWDVNVYKHIEHLRIPESTVIRDMMWEYGAWNYSAEEYKQLMMRLNTGMLWENPTWYDNYESIWWTPVNEPDNHAHAEWFTLNTLINHANFIIIDHLHRWEILDSLCKSNPNKINIIWLSKWNDANQTEYDARRREELKEYKEYDKEKNRLVFCAWSNITQKNWTVINKIFQEDYPLPDEHSVYGNQSRAHNKNDNVIDRHFVLTFATNKDGDLDLTDEVWERSRFPVWFHNKVLFAWRAFSYRNYNWDKIRATWALSTSHPNYLNVAIADLCFQMKADVADVDELLEMIRSTCLTDYIRLDGMTQGLQLMNPAGFFLKYLMPNDLPATISWSQTADLSKGYYHGLAFDIPGAEVKINGEWISFSDENKDLVFAQNPFVLEWRLNGDLLRKFGYKQGDTLKGKVIAIDDHWNGLNLSQDISITVSKEDTGIREFETSSSTTSRSFAPNGQRVGKGYKGIVISNGRKTITK